MGGLDVDDLGKSAMTFQPLPHDEHPTIVAAEFKRIRSNLTDSEALLLACLTNVLNELPDWLDGDYVAGSALDHAHAVINAMLDGPGLAPISAQTYELADELRRGET
ncbi:hypothetical protein [Labrys neptuniae]